MSAMDEYPLVMLKETVAPCLSPKICLARSSKRGGRGLFAKERIAKGEVVWREVDTSSSKSYTIDYVMALPEEPKKAFLHFAYCTFVPDVFFGVAGRGQRVVVLRCACAGRVECPPRSRLAHSVPVSGWGFGGLCWCSVFATPAVCARAWVTAALPVDLLCVVAQALVSPCTVARVQARLEPVGALGAWRFSVFCRNHAHACRWIVSVPTCAPLLALHDVGGGSLAA